MKQLLRFKHGLGDAVQFGIVLKHLKQQKPNLEIGIEAPVGLHSAFYGLADRVHILRHPFTWRNDYDETINVKFQRPAKTYRDVPSTKVTRCLIEEFRLNPDPNLYHYEINPPEECWQKVERFINEELNGSPYAVVHYQGTNLTDEKNLLDWEALVVCEMFDRMGILPVLIDFDYRSPLQDPRNYGGTPTIKHLDRRHPYLWDKEKVGDAATLAELIANAEYCVGIDSGIEHIAGATETPTFIIWWRTNPIHCYDLADNVTHFVPYFISDLTHEGEKPRALEYFNTFYQHETYTEDEPPIEKWVSAVLRLHDKETEPPPLDNADINSGGNS